MALGKLTVYIHTFYLLTGVWLGCGFLVVGKKVLYFILFCLNLILFNWFGFCLGESIISTLLLVGFMWSMVQ